MIYQLILLLLFTSVQEDWVLKKDEDGIRVFTRKVESTELKEFRAEMVIDGDMEQLYNVIMDFNNYNQWKPECISSKFLKETPDTITGYFLIDVPWPADNRDCITTCVVERSENSIRIDYFAEPDFAPQERKTVRIPVFKGFWLLEKTEEGKLKVVQQALLDPGGIVPSWVANLTIIDSPHKSFRNLRELVK